MVNSTSNPPLVSIKIASYNHGRFIGQAIKSVLSQTYQNLELIIVDDASQDNSLEIIKSYSDPRIQLIANEKNIGASASSKQAKLLCRGKYFCSLDSDDFFHPDKLAIQVAYMEEHPDVDVVASYVQEVNELDEYDRNQSTANWFNQNIDFNSPASWLWENHICHSSVLVRKDFHDKVWDYASGLVFTNDWYNWVRLLAAGARFAVIPKYITYYRRHAGNITSRNPEQAYWEYAYISAKTLHPYLRKLARHDLVYTNMLGFLKDSRYPVDLMQRRKLLELLGTDCLESDFKSLWGHHTSSTKLKQDSFEYLFEVMRQEWVASKASIASLKQERYLNEDELCKIVRFKHVWREEKLSRTKLAKLIYITYSLLVPDLLRSILKSLVRGPKKRLASWESPGVVPYPVNIPQAPSKTPRILHVIANFMAGGSSQLVVDILERLGGDYHQKVLTAFIPTPEAYSHVPLHESRTSHEIYTLIKDFQPDIIHVHYWGDSNWSWYDRVFQVAAQLNCKIIENINTPVTPYRCPSIMRYVYVSNFVMQSYGRSGEAAQVIYPGTNMHHYAMPNAHSEDCIGMVYRLESDKLNQHSIDALIEVARRRPDTKVLIAGDGSLRNVYERAVRENHVEESFTFLGSVAYSELPAVYRRLTIFVAPVWNESFGQVSCFAMSMGIPVVGYNVGGLPEIVANDDMLVPSGDSHALANLIITLLDDKGAREQVGLENHRRAEALFKVEEMIRKYSELYNEVIAAP